MLYRFSSHDPDFADLFERVCQRRALRDGLDGAESAIEIDEAVRQIIAEVRQRGDAALFEYTTRFDGFTPNATTIAVPKKRWREAYERCAPALREALCIAVTRVREFHRHQVATGYTVSLDDGGFLSQRVTPLERVGIYVPGGKARYPSSLIMNAVPARLAGVEQIIAVTPASADHVSDAVLAAAHLCEIDALFTVGGAQAIAALAYGTASIPRTDKIVGPGNAFVAAAKRLVFGDVAIDMIAGPSEVTIIADANANSAFLAADLIAQAEHDERAVAGIITPDRTLFERVAAELTTQLSTLPRQTIARRALSTYGYVLEVDSLIEAITAANRIAPEHLELHVDDPDTLLPAVKFAGTVFMGAYSPEAAGDYVAGPNHVLPTSGTARFSSPLGVYDFVTRMNVVSLSRTTLRELSPHIEALGREEGLDGHVRSAVIRTRDLEQP